MKLHALVGSTLIAMSLSLPAFAAAPAAPAANAAPGAESVDQAATNLKLHLKQAADLYNSVKTLKQRMKDKTKTVSAAEMAKIKGQLAKLKAMVAEAKAEGKAAKMMVLSAAVNKVEKEIAKLDPLAKPATDKP
ncbi:MAG: hypothetical protein JWM80_2804 [Cyanobacteria bacterium RYN_339]|nr:hypothetical protein [Cyanobacteria bacterium RYN_339]